ncbi:MAG: carbohydrate kinase family protein [Gammaproteobacteria bacterium]
MPTLITGSLAYDTIMAFPGRFKQHILPEQMHILNVCFVTPELRREFGGCCGNIAYNLKLLGGEPVAMGAVGEDFAPYRAWLSKNRIGLAHIREIPGVHTAQAFVTTDADNNQITAFHPGALERAHENKVSDAAGIDLGIVAPDGRDAMIQHAAQFAQAGIPFMFDPGQMLPMFGAEELHTFIEQAAYVVVNDYESELLREKTNATPQQIAARVDALIITRGAKGADIHHNGARIHIAPVQITEPKDPTGCGDAFRAGLLYGLANHLDWRTCGQIASLLGGIKIERHGTQNHRFTKQEFAARYRKNFAGELRLG